MKKWSHHTEHALFHGATGIISVLLATLCWLSTLGFWYYSQAGTVTSNQTLNITAQVGPINNGPDTSQNNGVAIPPPTTNQEINPINAGVTLITVGDTSHVNRVEGKDPIYIFDTQYPSFGGTTNLPYALIFLEIHSSKVIYGTTQADKTGAWSWQSPYPVTTGDHTLFATARHPLTTELSRQTSIQFIIDSTDISKENTKEELSQTSQTNQNHTQSSTNNPITRQENVRFLTTIDPRTKNIRAGEQIIIHINIIDNTKDTLKLPITYKILKPNGETVSTFTENAIFHKGTFTKVLYTSPNIATGKYTLQTISQTDNAIVSSEDNFTINGTPVLASTTGNIDLSFVYMSLFLLGLIFALIAYLEYRKVSILGQKILQIKEKDLQTAHLIQ